MKCFIQISGVIMLFVGLIVMIWYLPDASVKTSRLVGFQIGVGAVGLIMLIHDSIKDIVVKWKDFAMEARTWAKEAESKADEARELKEKTAALMTGAEKAAQASFESLAYSINTRNMFPIPDYVRTKIQDRMNDLAEIAYPIPKERSEVIARIAADINESLEAGGEK